MKLIWVLLGTLIMSFGLLGADSIHEFTMDSIQGEPVSLSEYAGKVVLLVNVASKCGNTPQYEGLEAMYEKYRDQGLVILGFPANNFAGQEPGTNAEILEFCQRTYNVEFPMFSKISVKGGDIAPLYAFLTDPDSATGGDVTWNFEKFLADRSGKIIGRFEPSMKPEAPEFVAAVEAALNK